MGIDLIPMPFFVDGETYLEGKDCTPETFFQRMKAGAEISTSQPAPEEIPSLWDTLLKTHDAVLHFPMSSGLSGSCHTAKALAQEYGGRVLVVDDRRISVTLAQSIRNAQVLLAQGKTAAEVRDILEAERDASSVYIAVNTLEYLHKGGRLPASMAVVGTLLKVKPLITLREGEVGILGKGLGVKNGLDNLLKLMGDEIHPEPRLPLYFGYTQTHNLCDQLRERVVEKYHPARVEQNSVGAVVGTHVGPDGAVVVYLDQE